MSGPKRSVLTRNMQVGECVSIDGGRIVMRLEARTGRSSARIRWELAADVVVSKPLLRDKVVALELEAAHP